MVNSSNNPLWYTPPIGYKGGFAPREKPEEKYFGQNMIQPSLPGMPAQGQTWTPNDLVSGWMSTHMAPPANQMDVHRVPGRPEMGEALGAIGAGFLGGLPALVTTVPGIALKGLQLMYTGGFSNPSDPSTVWSNTLMQAGEHMMNRAREKFGTTGFAEEDPVTNLVMEGIGGLVGPVELLGFMSKAHQFAKLARAEGQLAGAGGLFRGTDVVPQTELPGVLLGETGALFPGQVPQGTFKAHDPASILDLVQNNPEGFTVNPETFEPFKGSGWLVGERKYTSEHLNIPLNAPREVIEKKIAQWLKEPGVKRALKDPNRRFGGFVEKAPGMKGRELDRIVLDVPQVYDEGMKAEAIQAGIKGRERGVGHIVDDEYVGWEPAVPDREKWFESTPDRPYKLPKDEESLIADALAYHRAGAKNAEEWANNIMQTDPKMGKMLQENPGMRDRLYKINGKKGAQEFAEHLNQHYPREQALADVRRMLASNQAGYKDWYENWYPYIKNALPEDEALRITRASAAASSQSSPEEEAYLVLRAFDAWVHGEDIAKALTSAHKGGGIPIGTTGKISPNTGLPQLLYTPASGAKTKGIISALVDPIGSGEGLFGKAAKRVRLKIGQYENARLGVGDAPTLDSHMARLYTGKESVNDLTDAERLMVMQRMRDDAAYISEILQAEGGPKLSTKQAQALLWGHESGYDFSTLGATPEYWFREHMKRPEFARLAQKYPGLLK